MTPRRILLICLFFWCFGIVATPFLASREGIASIAAEFSYRFFSHVCHQLESRSFHLAGYKFAVCIRCCSIYTAFFLGVLFSPSIGRTKLVAMSPRYLLAASLLPMAADVGLSYFGVWESTMLTRIVTGSIFGFILSVVLTKDLEGTIHYIFLQLKTIVRTSYATKTR